MLWLGLLIAVAYWIFEAFVHSVAFQNGTTAGHLMPSDSHEVWTRSLVSALFIGFGCFAHVVLNRVQNARREQQRLQARLEQALTRALSGFLPICASCKKIRVEDADPERESSWHSVESYLHRRTDLEITHSLCPSCERELYWKKLATDTDDDYEI